MFCSSHFWLSLIHIAHLTYHMLLVRVRMAAVYWQATPTTAPPAARKRDRNLTPSVRWNVWSDAPPSTQTALSRSVHSHPVAFSLSLSFQAIIHVVACSSSNNDPVFDRDVPTDGRDAGRRVYVGWCPIYFMGVCKTINSRLSLANATCKQQHNSCS